MFPLILILLAGTGVIGIPAFCCLYCGYSWCCSPKAERRMTRGEWEASFTQTRRVV
jgi:hypothetical protein